MRISRLSLFLVPLIPLSVFASSGMLDPQVTIGQMNLLVAQYDARIKQLESENAILKYEMLKAGIKIPLTEYSGAIATPLPTTLPPSAGVTITGSTTVSLSGNSDMTLSDITVKYGKDMAGFISRVNKDWSAIKSAYTLPSNAHLAGYEWVQTGSQDHVFADIIVGTGTTGIYDIKILYQFEKSEYKRKLIGIFEYNPTFTKYTTKTGTNPFGGVPRTFIRDPYYAGAPLVPPATTTISASGGSSTPEPVVSPGATSSPTTGALPTMDDIMKAYNEKRYLTTISLSNSYLTVAKPTVELLSIRYRTYFIIGKYADSLSEIAKIEAISTLDRQTACNAQVIATYSKNQSLVDKYMTICKK